MGGGIVLATEVFVPTDAGRAQIRNNSLPQLYSLIEMGGGYKMHTLESSMNKLVQQGLVSAEVAHSHLAMAGERQT